MELLYEERARFIRENKIKLDTLSLRKKEDYSPGLEKAFDDAFRDYARRTGRTYVEQKTDLIKPVLERLFLYFSSDEDTFVACFADCITLSQKILDNNRFGLAQKFTNMAFKYLYCYGDALALEHKFHPCHMPLDRYTIQWVRSLKNAEINRALNSISNAWSRIEQPLYNAIQDLIHDTLNNQTEYTITHNQNAEKTTCILPQNQLQAEFIIWHQEKVNELRRILETNAEDFDRLGIAWL